MSKKINIEQFKKVLMTLIKLKEESLISHHLKDNQKDIMGVSQSDKNKLVPQFKTVKENFQNAYKNNLFVDQILVSKSTIQKEISISSEDQKQIEIAIKKGNFVKLENLLEQHSNWNFLNKKVGKGGNGLSWLHFVCKTPGSFNIDKDYKTDFKDNILQYKAQERIIKECLNKKMNFNDRNNKLAMSPTDIGIMDANANIFDKIPALLKSYSSESTINVNFFGRYVDKISFFEEFDDHEVEEGDKVSPAFVLFEERGWYDVQGEKFLKNAGIRVGAINMVNVLIEQKHDLMSQEYNQKTFLIHAIEKKDIGGAAIIAMLKNDKKLTLNLINQKTSKGISNWMNLDIETLRSIPVEVISQLSLEPSEIKKATKNEEKLAFLENMYIKNIQRNKNPLTRKSVKVL